MVLMVINITVSRSIIHLIREIRNFMTRDEEKAYVKENKCERAKSEKAERTRVSICKTE